MTIDSPQRQLQDACTALDQALRSGHEARVETWLAACPALASDDDLAIELIYSEYVTREALGPVPTAEEYYHRFPNWADRLHRLFEVDELLKPTATVADDDTATDTHKPLTVTPPKRIGQFELHERLGGGGMGVVYRARQAKPSREVAIKLLRAGSEAGATERARFRREAEAIARLQHPNIVAVYEVGEVDEQPYLAMELVSGGDLHSILKGRPQSPAWAARLMATLAKAVQFAHDHGIVHRDIKPGNILRSGEEPKLTDFGLAALNDSSEGLTRTGQVLGTLAYLAPEQAAATHDAVLPSVDIYALGAVLYECLTGRPPFVADAEATTLEMILHADPVSPRKLNPGVPRDLETIALKCLAKSPLKRYRTSLALAEDLERFRQGEPILARPVGAIEAVWRWTRRRPTQASLVGVSIVAAAIIVAITASYTSRLATSLKDEDQQRQRAEGNARSAHEQRERAEANERAAQSALAAESRRRAQARSALDQLTERLLEEGTRSIRKNSEQMASLEAALKSYEELAADTASDEASRSGVARACWRAATLANHLGRFAEAEQMLERSLVSWKSLQADFPSNLSHFRGYAVMLNDRGTIRASQKKHAEAARDYLESFELQKLYHGEDTTLHNIFIGTTATNLSICYRALDQQSQTDEREAIAIGLWEQFVAQDANEQRYRNGLAHSLQQRGLRLHKAGQRDAARADYKRAIELRIRDGKVTTITSASEEQASCHEHLARLAVEESDRGTAAVEYREALIIREQLFANNPASNSHFASVVTLLNSLYLKGEHLTREELEPVFARVRPRLVTRAATEGEPDLLVLAAGVACNHGNLLARMDRPLDALWAYDDAQSLLERLLSIKADHRSGNTFFVNTVAGKASVYRTLERFTDVVKCLDAALAHELPGPRRLIFGTERALALARGGEAASALEALEALAPPAKGKVILRAQAYALVVSKCSDDDLRNQAADKALAWLKAARDAGELGSTSVRDHLKSDADWAAMRKLHGVDVLLEGKKN